MKEKPIIFKSEMVRAILDDRKTQTRMVIKPQPFGEVEIIPNSGIIYPFSTCGECYCVDFPYQPRDHLWVRETFYQLRQGGVWINKPECIRYFEWTDDFNVTYTPEQFGYKKRPSLYMPRWAARLWLEVLKVGVERVQDISGKGAVAEGFGAETPAFQLLHYGGYKSARNQFKDYWDTIYRKKPEYQWQANPWVWVYEFRRINKTIGGEIED